MSDEQDKPAESNAGIPQPDIPKPSIPKPTIPTPSIPKPDIPKPSIPKPNIETPAAAKEETAAEPTPPKDEVKPAAEPVAKTDDEPSTSLLDTDEFAEAAFKERALAGLIDWAVWLVLYIVLIDYVAYVAATAYMLTRDTLPFLNGQSIGKKVMKLRAIGSDGKDLNGNWQKGVLRNVLFLVPLGGLVELGILYLKDSDNKPLLRLGDEWFKTEVIVVNEAPNIEQ